jgi:two-component system C4-dicarboxylate transport response regulator DctD
VLGLPGAPLLPGLEQPVGRRSLAEQIEAHERSIIERALAEANGNVAEVMQHLDVPRRTLIEKMARLGIGRKRGDRPEIADSPKTVGGN